MMKGIDYIVDSIYLKRLGPLVHSNRVRINDVLFLSFPKSGRTWARYFFASYIAQLIGDDLPVEWDQFTVYTPSYRIGVIGAGRDLLSSTTTEPRMIWSHDRHARRYICNRKVVFFTRDIISLIESYFFFHQKRNGLPSKTRTLDDYALRGFDHTKCIEVINGFCSKFDQASEVKIVRYEDMKLNNINVFKELLAFSGLFWNEQFFHRAVEMSSFSKMRETELRYKRQHDDDLHLRAANGRGDTSISDDVCKELYAFYRANLPIIVNGYWQS